MGKGRPDLTSLRQQIQVRKNEVKNSPLEEKKILRIEDLDLSIANITEDEGINQRLRESVFDFINYTATSKLWYGEHFQKVFEILGNGENANQYTSYYNEYLKLVGVNPKTARRYRKRYQYYRDLKNENLKSLIAILSDEDIEYLDKNPDFLTRLAIEYENKKITKDEFKSLKKLEYKESIVTTDDIEILPAFNIEDFSIKLEEVQEKVKEIKITEKNSSKINELQKYLIKIEKVLQEIN